MCDKEIEYCRSVRVRYETDVLVVGGGPAGIAAAVQCARTGADVILAEQSGSLGGSSILAMVPEIMNFDDGKQFLTGGFGRELHDALFGECEFRRRWHNIRPEPLKRYYDGVVADAGVRLLLFARLTDVIREQDTLTHAIFSGQEGLFAIAAKMFVDCTGNALLCRAAGVPCDWGDENGMTMSATLASLWGGVDFDRKKSDGEFIQKALQDGVLSQYDTVLPGIKRNFPEVGVGGGNVGHMFRTDDRTSETLTAAMLQGRKILAEYEQYYRRYVGGCENAVLLRTADMPGIRESYRVRTITTLTAEHFSDGYVWKDEIGRYSYPIDIHPVTADAAGMNGFGRSVSIRHEDGESYGIPYGCLVPISAANLLTAGRCIGADRPMQASARVIPCCYITGQAAGVAAALCVKNAAAAADMDIAELQRQLRALGADIRSA